MVAGKDGTRLRTRALSATLKTLSPNNRQIISSDETIRQIILPQLERSMADSLSRVQLSLGCSAPQCTQRSVRVRAPVGHASITARLRLLLQGGGGG